ncbi:MAG: hypothetical protein J5765_00095, partial [Clostridia bacterium]|nr:hypothetical protein [Clostridia bacterium]
FLIAPKPGGSITHAECSYDSVYGKVSCKWVRVGDEIKYTVNVPANTTAIIRLPGGDRTVTAGTYEL